MNLIIKRLDGTEYRTQDYGLKTLDFRIDSPSPNTITEIIEGRSGFIDLGTVYEGRSMEASFFMSTGSTEYTVRRNDIFRIFDSREHFYLIDDREPSRRWLVKCDGGYQIEQITANKGRFNVQFISSQPYSESTFTTLNPDEHSQVLQVSQENFNDPPVQYSFTTDTFFVWNDADITINPREHYLKIIFSGASTNLQIDNLTTGDTWSYTGSTIAGDEVVIEGIRSLKNGTSIFRDTNRKLITLSRGWNEFTIMGATDINIDFDLRFIYL